MSVNNSNRTNYNPSIWGPKGWFFLDTIILSYPNNPNEINKKNFSIFFNNIGDMLPCDGCRQNYAKHIKDNQLNEEHLQSRDALIKWWLNIHNLTRKSMNKEQLTPINFLDYYCKCYNTGNTNYIIKELQLDNESNNNFMNLIYIMLLIFSIIAFKKWISNK